MSTTIVDSLLVTLGFSTKGMKQGAADAAKMQEQIRLDAEKSAAAFQKQQESAAAAFGAMQDKAVASGKITASEADKRSKEFQKQQASEAAIFTKSQKEQIAISTKKATEERKAGKDREQLAKKATDGLSKMRNEMLGIATALLGVAGLKSFGEHLVGTTAELGRTSDLLGVGTERLAGWQAAAKKADTSIASVRGALASMNKLAQQLKTGDSAGIESISAYAMALAGVNTKTGGKADISSMSVLSDRSSSSEEKLLEIAKETAELSEKDRALVLSKLNIAEDMSLVLTQGRDALAASVAHFSALHPDIKQAQEESRGLIGAWVEFKETMSGVFETIEVMLKPALDQVKVIMKSIGEWAQAHPQLMSIVFAGLLALVTAITVAMTAMTTAMIFGPAIAALGGIAAILTGIVAPVLLAIAAVAALSAIVIVLYKDWKAFIDGGKSEFAGFWAYVKGAWESLSGILAPVFDAAKALFNSFYDVVKDGIGFVVALFTGSGDDIRAAWTKLFTDLGTFFDGFGRLVSHSIVALIKLIIKAIPSIYDALIVAFGAAFSWISDRAGAVWDAIRGNHSEAKPTESAPTTPADGGEPQAGLLGLVRKLEGSGDNAVSPAGAIGRYQIMPGTARQYGFDPAKLTDPQYNEMVAKVVLSDLQKKYGTDTDAILTGYNAGPGRANKFIASGRNPSVLPRETQNYLTHAHQIMAASNPVTVAQAAQPVAGQTVPVVATINVPKPDPAILSALRPGPPIDKGLATGAQAAVTNNQANTSNQSSNSNQVETHIENLTVNAPNAKTNKDVASAMVDRLQSYSFASMANVGLA